MDVDDARASARTPARRVARAVTEVFAPAIWAAAMPLVVAVQATVEATGSVAAGLAWGGLAALFGAVVPYGIIWLGVRRGHLSDHRIRNREQRVRPMLLGLLSVLVGLALLVLLGAPRALTAMVVTMFVIGAGCTAVNHYWKLSVHTAVAAGSSTVLVVVFGPELLASAAVVALTGWSRVEMGDHTPAQVLAGAAAGTALAAATFILLA
jgi:membrane-associated phospholipid phosphatase